jgi:hypothetical protein
MWSDAPDCHQQCATEMCCRPASSRLEVGGIGSYYCESCREIIERGRRYGETRTAIVETVPSGGVLHRMFVGEQE